MYQSLPVLGRELAIFGQNHEGKSRIYDPTLAGWELDGSNHRGPNLRFIRRNALEEIRQSISLASFKIY
jgi:hypothetical protein